MDEEPKNDGKQPSSDLLAIIIVKDYVAYLDSGTKGVELESLVQYHIKKVIDNPKEDYIKEVMNKVIEFLRIRHGSTKDNSKK